MTLVEWLEERRWEKRLSHSQFAAFLEISPTLWKKLRSGDRAVTLWLVDRVVAKFPHERDTIFSFALAGTVRPTDGTVRKPDCAEVA